MLICCTRAFIPFNYFLRVDPIAVGNPVCRPLLKVPGESYGRGGVLYSCCAELIQWLPPHSKPAWSFQIPLQMPSRPPNDDE
jgi:hypothetical protein